MPSVIGQLLHHGSVEARLAAFFHPQADPWERLRVEVRPAVFGGACTRAFGDFLQGPGTVQTRDLDELCAWLRGCSTVADSTLFFTDDYWQHPVTFEQLRQGDCEDHALWAWRQLHRLGIPALFMSGLWRSTPHAWIILTLEGRECVLETTAKSGPMLLPLPSARTDYCPAVAVDHQLATYVYQGFQQRHARAGGPAAKVDCPTSPPAQPLPKSLPLDFEIVILAGGKSSRMGRDKARLRLGGRSMLARIRDTASQLGQPVRVLRRDEVPTCGPLGGMVTALRHTSHEVILFLGCDMPALSSDLLRHILERFTPEADAVCVVADGQPGFPFALRRRCLPTLEQQIVSGHLSLHQLRQATRALDCQLSGAPAEQLRNLNTPEDLQAYRQHLRTTAKSPTPPTRRIPPPLAGWLIPLLLLLGLGLARAQTAPPGLPPPEQWLPAETLAFISVPSAAWAKSEILRHSPGAFWSDPAVQPLRSSFEQRLESRIHQPLARLTGLHLGQLLGLAEGQITCAWLDGPPPAASTNPAPIEFLLVLDAGSKSNQLATLGLAARAYAATNGLVTARSVSVEGVDTLHLRAPGHLLHELLELAFPAPEGSPGRAETNLPPTDILLAARGSWFVATSSTSHLPGVLARLQGAPPVTRWPEFALASPNPSQRLVHAYLHVPSALARAPRDSTTTRTPLALPAFGSARLNSALGLDQIRGAAFEIRADPEGWLTEYRLALPIVLRKGLFRLFQPLPAEASPPDWIPDDILSFARLRLPGPTAWASLQRILRDIDPALLGVVQLFTEYAGRTEDVDFNFDQGLIANLGDDWIAASRRVQNTNVWGADLLVHGTPQAAAVGHALRLIASPTYLATFLPPGAPPPERTFRQVDGHRVVAVQLPPFPWQSGAPRWLHLAHREPWVAMAGTGETIDRFLTLTNAQAPLARSSDFLRGLAAAGGAQGGFVAYSLERETVRHAFGLLARGPEPLEDLVRWAAISDLTTRTVLAAIGWIDLTKLPPYDRVARHFRYRVESGRSSSAGWTLTTFRPSPPSSPPPLPTPAPVSTPR